MKISKKYGYMIMSIKDKKEVVIDRKAVSPGLQEEEVFNRLRERILAKEQEPKYLLFDFKLETSDGRREKIAFINW